MKQRRLSFKCCVSRPSCAWHTVHVCLLSHFSRVQLFVTLWTVAHQAPLSMQFSRHEHWSGLPCPPPGDLPNPGMEPTSLMSPALGGGFFTTSATWEAPANKDWLPLAVLCSVAELCLTLCKPMNCSPPDSSVHGIFQARILEWVAIPSSRDLLTQGWKAYLLHLLQSRWILYH